MAYGDDSFLFVPLYRAVAMVNFRWRVFLEINNGDFKDSDGKIDSCQRFGFILSKAKLKPFVAGDG